MKSDKCVHGISLLTPCEQCVDYYGYNDTELRFTQIDFEFESLTGSIYTCAKRALLEKENPMPCKYWWQMTQDIQNWLQIELNRNREKVIDAWCTREEFRNIDELPHYK